MFPLDDLRQTLKLTEINRVNIVIICTFDEDVDELDLRFSKSVSIGNIPSSSGRGRVDTGGSSSLESHSGADLFEVLAGRKERDFHLKIFY